MAVAAVDKAPTHLLLTHAHIDHAGGAAEIKRRTGCRVIIHTDDAQVLADGDTKRSAADWYGLALEPLEADEVLGATGPSPCRTRRSSISYTPPAIPPARWPPGV